MERVENRKICQKYQVNSIYSSYSRAPEAILNLEKLSPQKVAL